MAHKHKDLIIAWANGAKIQGQIAGPEEWLDITEPGWYTNILYRIKPEQKADVHKYVNVYKGGTGSFFPTKGETRLYQRANCSAMLKLTWDGETGALKSVEKINV